MNIIIKKYWLKINYKKIFKSKKKKKKKNIG